MYSWTNKFQNCRFNGRGTLNQRPKLGIGIKTGIQCNSNSYINCNVADCDTGIQFTGGSSQNFNFLGGQIENCESYAISILSNNQLRGVTIIGNYFENYCPFFSAVGNSNIGGLIIEGNHTATNGDGLALELSSSSGRINGQINSNTFTRVNNTIDGQFVSLVAGAYVNLQNNKGYKNDVSYTDVEILTDSTLSSTDSRYFTRTDTTYPHRFNVTGTVSASKGVVIGAGVPFSYSRGQLLYDTNADLINQRAGSDASTNLYLQTTRNGATSARPTITRAGQQFFDTTLGKPIWWVNSTIGWVDSTGATV